MYTSLYFDLDDTLVEDNQVTGKSELLNSGFEKYTELVKNSPKAIKILLTNRNSKDIKFPAIYSFDEVVGKDNMEVYIERNLNIVTVSNLSSLKSIYLFLRGIYLYKSKQTPKLLYIFLRSVIKNERIHVLDDDRRVSGMFSK